MCVMHCMRGMDLVGVDGNGFSVRYSRWDSFAALVWNILNSKYYVCTYVPPIKNAKYRAVFFTEAIDVLINCRLSAYCQMKIAERHSNISSSSFISIFGVFLALVIKCSRSHYDTNGRVWANCVAMWHNDNTTHIHQRRKKTIIRIDLVAVATRPDNGNFKADGMPTRTCIILQSEWVHIFIKKYQITPTTRNNSTASNKTIAAAANEITTKKVESKQIDLSHNPSTKWQQYK